MLPCLTWGVHHAGSRATHRAQDASAYDDRRATICGRKSGHGSAAHTATNAAGGDAADQIIALHSRQAVAARRGIGGDCVAHTTAADPTRK